MKLRAVFLFAVLLAAGCDKQQKISAQDMKRTLQSDVFDFNRDLNAVDLDAARNYLHADAGPAFETLLAGYKNGDYNFFQTNEPPEIDYLDGEAKVVVQLFKGERKNEIAGAREVGRQTHVWKFVNGTWQWLGPVSR